MSIWLANGPIDRHAELRTRPEGLEAELDHPDARILPVAGTDNMIVRDGDAALAGWLPVADVDWPADALVYLGRIDDAPVFAAAVPNGVDMMSLPGEFKDLRRLGTRVGREDAATLAYARAMVYWHQQHQFCGVCGHPTVPKDGGHKRQCVNPDCLAEHFPRTDGAMIVIVHDGADRCLLARGQRFPPHMYSALAGFLEPSESLEECVVREVYEEVGLRVTDVRYHSSQPWPFPRSIMIGFHARTEDTELRLDHEEIADARWVTRDFLLAKDQWEDFFIPPRFAVARRLIDDWVAGKIT